MTTADMLEARGEARGKAEGRAEMLTQVLTARFGPLPESTTQAINEASSDQLSKWGAQAGTAATLDDVFA